MSNRNFNQKSLLDHGNGVIIVTNSDINANKIFSSLLNGDSSNANVYSLQETDENISKQSINQLLNYIIALRNNREDQFGNGQYNPVFLLAFDRDKNDNQASQYLFRKLRKNNFVAEQISITGDYLTIHDFAEHDSESFDLALENAIQNPNDNFGKFIDKVSEQQHKPISSGIPLIDVLLHRGFYPGLYVLGATSAMGKTSLMLQIADHIAETGKNVMYFALEMSPEELIAKSISRICWSINEGQDYANLSIENRPTARNIMDGNWEEKWGDNPEILHNLNLALNYYRTFTSKMSIQRQALNRPSADEIADQVENYILRTGKYPVVFIDYLQLLRGKDPRATDKKNITSAINSLKILSLTYQIPVIVVSSFNRSNYNNIDVGLDAFKESGDIEYTADAVMTLENDYRRIQAPKEAGILGIDEKTTMVNLYDAIKDSKSNWDAEKASMYAMRLYDHPVQLKMLKTRFGDINAPYAPLYFKGAYSVFGYATDFHNNKKIRYILNDLEDIDKQRNYLKYIRQHQKFSVDDD